MAWNRTYSIAAAAGVATAGAVAATLLYRWRHQDGHTGGSALAHGDRHAANDVGSTRSAGPDAMRDPPGKWDRVDQSADESFPASDPPPVGSKVD